MHRDRHDAVLEHLLVCPSLAILPLCLCREGIGCIDIKANAFELDPVHLYALAFGYLGDSVDVEFVPIPSSAFADDRCILLLQYPMHRLRNGAMIELEDPGNRLRAEFIGSDLVEVIYDSIPHFGPANCDGAAPLLTARTRLSSKATQPLMSVRACRKYNDLQKGGGYRTVAPSEG